MAITSRKPVHPNDHVNRGQSSNDSLHVTAVEAVQRLTGSLGTLHGSLAACTKQWDDIVKIGRTHMMDAVPMTLGQECSAWARRSRCRTPRRRAAAAAAGAGRHGCRYGSEPHPDFDRTFCNCIGVLTGQAFAPNPNTFEGMGAHDALVELSGMLNVIAVSFTKLGNNIRPRGSGPRAGLAELVVPADGLSSAIMPGKTNPTQFEALTMVAAQVMGNHVSVTIAGAQSFLELNVFKPVIIYNVLQSCSLLADAAESFADNVVDKLEPNREHTAENVAKSLMLVTALNPRIGYDRAVRIGKTALVENITLKGAAARLGYVSPEDFDRWVVPADITRPGATLEGGSG